MKRRIFVGDIPKEPEPLIVPRATSEVRWVVQDDRDDYVDALAFYGLDPGRAAETNIDRVMRERAAWRPAAPSVSEIVEDIKERTRSAQIDQALTLAGAGVIGIDQMVEVLTRIDPKICRRRRSRAGATVSANPRAEPTRTRTRRSRAAA
jgi:hypothetical protein